MNKYTKELKMFLAGAGAAQVLIAILWFVYCLGRLIATARKTSTRMFATAGYLCILGIGLFIYILPVFRAGLDDGAQEPFFFFFAPYAGYGFFVMALLTFLFGCVCFAEND